MTITAHPILTNQYNDRSNNPNGNRRAVPLNRIVFRSGHTPELRGATNPLSGTLKGRHAIRQTTVRDRFQVPVARFQLLKGVNLQRMKKVNSSSVSNTIRLNRYNRKHNVHSFRVMVQNGK